MVIRRISLGATGICLARLVSLRTPLTLNTALITIPLRKHLSSLRMKQSTLPVTWLSGVEPSSESESDSESEYEPEKGG